ncbi:hypothetical protein OAY16_03040 [Candidatus Pelagibacter sp.]|nr:hypothetical protein [Candidatus Pelagibacter sp.]
MLQIKEIYPKLFKFDDFKSIHPIKKKQNIMIFSLSFIWIKYLTLLSSVLVLKNCNVTLIWSKFFFQDNQNPKENEYEISELKKSFSKKTDNFFAIEIDNIKNNNQKISSDEYDKIFEQSKIDVVQVKKKVRINIEKDEKDFFQTRLEINLKTYRNLKYYLKFNSIDKVIIPNGALYEWGIAKLVCDHLKVNYITLEGFFGIHDDVICTRENQNCLIWDDNQINNLWEKNFPYKFDEKKNQSFIKWFNKVNSKKDEHSIQIKAKDLSKNILRKKYDIKDDDIVCLITPSFSYEKHFRLEKYCFKDHTDWLINTVNYIKNKKAKFIFKCHPIPYDPENDKFGFRNHKENSEEILKNNFKELPENLIIIKPEEKISINSLIDISNFGISYFSSSAIELAWQGKKSIVCSNIHFANKEFVNTAKNEKEYYNFIDFCCRNIKNCELGIDLINKSKYYVDVWYNQMPDKIQWNILRGYYNYDKFPINRVMSLNFLTSNYSKTFDKLAGIESFTAAEITENYIRNLKSKEKFKVILKYENLDNIKFLLKYCLKKRDLKYIYIVVIHLFKFILEKFFKLKHT